MKCRATKIEWNVACFHHTIDRLLGGFKFRTDVILTNVGKESTDKGVHSLQLPLEDLRGKVRQSKKETWIYRARISQLFLVIFQNLIRNRILFFQTRNQERQKLKYSLTMFRALLGLLTLVPALMPASASAALSTPSNLNSRRDMGIYGCENAGWNGPCWWQSATKGTCHPIGKVGSFGPDKGIVCQVFSEAGCDGDMVGGLRSPGTGDLHGYIASDNMGSFSGPKSFACKAG